MVRFCVALLALIIALPAEGAETPPESEAVESDGGKHYDKDGIPTYKIQEDGTVDWYTYSGFRRYHSECHTCHGPDGLGSSYAPAMTKSLETMTYSEFMDIVVNGRENVSQAEQNVMPGFGTNENVMCFLDDIYIYLRARSDGVLPRGRPGKRVDKPKAADEAVDACFGD